MSDLELTASIDFTEARREVDKFVEGAKQKLSTIMSAATARGGSLAAASGGAGASGGGVRTPNNLYFNTSALDKYKAQIAELTALERAFSDNTIKWHAKMEAERTRISRQAAAERAKLMRDEADSALNALRDIDAMHARNAQAQATREKQINASQTTANRARTADAKRESDERRAYEQKAAFESGSKEAQMEAMFRSQEKANTARALADKRSALAETRREEGVNRAATLSWMAEEKVEAARVADVRKSKAAESAAFDEEVSKQALRNRRSYASMIRNLIAEQASDSKNAADQQRAEDERISGVRKTKAAENAAFDTEVSKQALRNRQSYASMLRNLINDQVAQEKSAAEQIAAEDARRSEVRKAKAAEDTAFEAEQNKQALRNRQSYISMFSRLLDERDTAERASATSRKDSEDASTKASADAEKQRTQAQKDAEKQRTQAQRDAEKERLESLRRSTAEQNEARRLVARTGSVTAASGSFQNTIDSKLGNLDQGAQVDLTNRLDDATQKYLATLRKYGTQSMESTRASNDYREALGKIRQDLQGVETAAKAAARAEEALSAATRNSARNNDANLRRDINATTVVAVREAGITNRIDRQVEDPKLQEELLRRISSAAGDATRAIRMYGAASVEATVANAAFRMEARSVGDAITAHNGLFAQLRRNATTLGEAIQGAGGHFGNFSRLLLNTQVALSAMTAAFGVREILQTAESLETVQNTLRAVSPSAEDATKNFNFLRAAGESVGFSYLDAGKSFAQFTAATIAAGASTEQTQQAFLRLTMAARNFGLSSADTDGVIRAMTQSFSKGRFSAEEMRQQLGDRMPVAMAALAKATGMSGQALEKMMKEGKITTAEFAIPFINAMLEMSGGMGAAERNSTSLNASLGRMKNAWAELVRNSPDVDSGLRRSVDAVTALTNSNFASEGFKTLGLVLGKLGDGLMFVVSIADKYMTPMLEALNESLEKRTSPAVAVAASLIGGALSLALAAATTAVIAFTAATLASPIGLMIFGIGALVAAYLYYKDTLISVGGQTMRVMDLIGASFDYIGQVAKNFWKLISDHAASSMRSLQDPVDMFTGAIASSVMTIASWVDTVTTLFKSLPVIAAAVATDVAGNFSAMADNIQTVFRNILSVVQVALSSMVSALGEGFAALANGDFRNAGARMSKAFGDSLADGLQTAFRAFGNTRQYTNTAGEVISTAMAENGSTAATSFVNNFADKLSSLGPEAANALRGFFGPTFDRILTDASQRTAAAFTQLVDDQGNVVPARGSVQFGPPTPPRSLVGDLSGRMGRTTPPDADPNAERLANSVKELMQDLGRQSRSAGLDTGAATEYAKAINRIADAAENGKGRINAAAESTRAWGLITERLNKEFEKYVRETDRAVAGNQAITAGFNESAAAGRTAEIRVRAMAKALETVSMTDKDGKVTAESMAAYNARVLELIPNIDRLARSEKSREAARALDKGRDDLEVMRLEQSMIGQNTNLIEQEVAAMRARQQTRGADQSQIDAAVRQAKEIAQVRQQTEQLNNSWQELSKIGEQAFDRIGAAITDAFTKGKDIMVSFKSVAKAVFSEIIQAALKMAIINPILNSIFGGNRGTAGGLLQILGGDSSSSLVGGVATVASLAAGIGDKEAAGYAIINGMGPVNPDQLDQVKTDMATRMLGRTATSPTGGTSSLAGILGSGGSSGGTSLTSVLGAGSSLYTIGSRLGVIPEGFSLGNSLGLTGQGGILTNAGNSVSNSLGLIGANGSSFGAIGETLGLSGATAAGTTAAGTTAGTAAGTAATSTGVSALKGLATSIADAYQSISSTPILVNGSLTTAFSSAASQAALAAPTNSALAAMPAGMYGPATPEAVAAAGGTVGTVGQVVGGAAGVIGGAYGIYAGIEKGGWGGAMGAAGGAVTAVMGASALLTAAGVAGASMNPIGWVIGAVLAIASMFVPGEKPSNMEGNATMDMSNGSVSQGGSTGSKFSQSNRDMSSRALGAIGFLTDKVKGMLNVSASGSVQVGVGNRDGIYYRVNGEGHGYGRNEKGFNDLTRDALLDTLHKLLVGNEATVNASKGIDGTTIEEIFAGVAKVAEVTNNGRASASQDIASRRLDFSGHFDQAIEELRWVRDVYDNIVSGEYTKGLSSYLKGVQDLNTNWTGLIAHAEALGLATEKLSEAWAAATAELKDARDSKLQSLDTSITSRALKLNGNVGDNLKADVADYQAKAREEMLQVKSSYRDLGLSPQEMAASISALGDIQARELAAILQKYADSASQWVANTYNALTGRTNQFAQSMESLVTQFDAAIYMAKQLGISETDLVAARTTAIADLLYQRDLQARGLHDGLSIRSLKMVGTDAANLTADLMTSDLNALQEKLTFKKSLVDLGLTSAQVGAEMVRLEAVQADERLAIIKKYNDAVLQAEAERQSKAQIAVMDMANGVRDYVHTLRTGDSSPLSEATKYDIARMDFNTASDKATTGDWNSIATLKDYASSFIDASRTYNGSGTTFVADFDRAIAALQAVAEQTPDTLTASFLAQATQTQTTTLVESLTAVKEEITALRREVRQQSLTPERVAA